MPLPLSGSVFWWRLWLSGLVLFFNDRFAVLFSTGSELGIGVLLVIMAVLALAPLFTIAALKVIVRFNPDYALTDHLNTVSLSATVILDSGSVLVPDDTNRICRQTGGRAGVGGNGVKIVTGYRCRGAGSGNNRSPPLCQGTRIP